jgi:hypothetical protein
MVMISLVVALLSSTQSDGRIGLSRCKTLRMRGIPVSPTLSPGGIVWQVGRL